MSTNVPVPFADPMFDTLRPAAGFASLDPTTDSLADGIGTSYGIIRYKGKVWTLRHGGKTHTFVRPDDGAPIGYIDVVVLRQPPGKSKSFFPAYDPNASEGMRPICASLDGITPDLDVQQKQADACAICPRNQWRMDAKGRKTRDYQDYKRLAVLIMPAQTKALLGDPLMEPAFLRIPPASLTDLAELGKYMDSRGFLYVFGV